mgnify:CR=1 FL=1
MELFISIIAILISAISLYFSAYPIYCKYMREAEETVLTVTDNKVENGIIKLCVVYSNLEYKGIIITNSCIMLSPTPLSNVFTYSNDKASKSWIEPIVFTEKGNSSLVLEYALPDLSITRLDNINIMIQTYYIDSKGKSRRDDFNVGLLSQTDNGAIAAYVEHVGHVLKGEEVK